ncbi:YdeI/OmpD-associated family protein [Ornithinimicrobium avium]|uniref:DUF1905 domain-containing protein n=1 Tax=Ornithinimicrobium avium TaxID=2283195 RepID=A0A345NMM2_9MICO|nr:YdeI/OmpD-associated family protein [Ornithinimicrobium avium]AXH96280.1 DUF1905 domain-containing protein [Ornithinimicrobium avium]
MSITFDAVAQQVGERILLTLPQSASQALPSRGQVAVEAQIGGHAFMTVLEPDGRKGHWISVDEKLREALSLEAGDGVHGALTPTRVWPEPEVPEDLDAALSDAPDSAGTWTDITPMARWEWVRWVTSTRSATTRERRVEVTVDKLRAGKRRPCCFDLSSCTDPELSRSGKLVDVS